MKITQIDVHSIKIPFKPLGSLWVGRIKPSHLESIVVQLHTDSGLNGFGESCPIGAVYLPAFSKGLIAAIELMAPALLGQDPICVQGIYQTMNQALYGHGYAKAAIDIACWDLFGKQAGLSISELMGGRQSDSIPVYASIPLDDVKVMVSTLKQKQSEGFSRFQIKIGDEPLEDVERVKALVKCKRPGDVFMADANRGWSKADGIRAASGLVGVDCYLEQPCATYDACMAVRSRCDRPMILDEIINDATDLVCAISENALDGLVIKVTHAGGLTPARLMRDICVRHGIKMRIEDTAGTEITRATQAQLAAASPVSLQLGSYSFINDMDAVASGAPELRRGNLHLNNQPGLGIKPHGEMLGETVASFK